jgi:hypothetical protein
MYYLGVETSLRLSNLCVCIDVRPWSSIYLGNLPPWFTAACAAYVGEKLKEVEKTAAAAVVKRHEDGM